jgi:hypothetical protein
MRMGDHLKAAEAIFESVRSPLPRTQKPAQSQTLPKTECAGLLDRPNLYRDSWTLSEDGSALLPGFSNGRTEPLNAYAVRSQNAGDRVDAYIEAISLIEPDPKQGL